MKQLRKIFLVIVLGLFTAVTLTACGSAKIVSGRIKADTMETEIYVNSTLDTSGAVAIFTYSNNKEVEVKAKDLTFSALNTATVGTKQLTITYKGFSFKIDIIVAELDIEVADQIAVTSFSSDLLVDFSENKQIQENKETEFYDRTAPLYVGDDNAFNLKLKINGINILTGELETDAQRVRTTISAWLKDTNGDYQVLEDEALEALVAINDEYTTFDFTTTAVGKTFKFQVEPTNVADDYEINPIVFEVVVVDGFNVYTAKELSVYDNVNENNRWNDIKGSELGGVAVSAIVLQGDIVVTKNDAPASMFWQEGETGYNDYVNLTDQTLHGSLKDVFSTGIYKRKVAEGDNFTMYGNYFAVDASQLPKMVIENAEHYVSVEGNTGMTGHTPLFYTYADKKASSAASQVVWKNVSFIGNTALNNDVRNSGGILLMKNNTVDFHAYNTIHRNFTVGWFMEEGQLENANQGNYVIEKSKGYKAYSTLFYIWGAENLLIKESEFKGAGGPVLIADDIRDSSNNEIMPSHVTIVATELESLVAGQEPWFNMYEGSGAIVGGLAAADPFYGDGALQMGHSADKTLIGGTTNGGIQQLNVIAALKSSEAQGLTNARINGWIRIYDTVSDYVNNVKVYGLDMDATDHVAGGGNLVDRAMDTGNSYLQSSGNGGYIAPVIPPAVPDTSWFGGVAYNVGTYVNVYTSMGMGAIVKLYDRV